MSEKIFIHSGDCCLCEIGIETGSVDADGKALHTGDIVSLYTLLSDETLDLVSPLTAIVCDQLQSYSDGSVRLRDGDERQFYTMGIRTAGISSPEWRVVLAKSFRDVVPGEHWPSYGFSYRANDAAEAALAKAGGSHD